MWGSADRNKSVVAGAPHGQSPAATRLLLIPLQLATSPKLVFAIGIPFDVAIQRSHDADARKHCRPAKFRDQEQRLHRGLPWLAIVLYLGQLGDVFCRIPERDELATAGQGNRIVEKPLPVRHQAVTGTVD
jgi:hypothetical protein